MSDLLVERRSAPSFNVGVLLEVQYRILKSGFRTSVWTLAELLIRGEGDDNARVRTLVDDTESLRRYLWTGLSLSFFRDGGESYWHSLVGEQQEIFVVCQGDQSGAEDEFEPVLVTADYDEAMAYHEADDTVLTAPMPAVVYQSLERFVLENYAPEKRHKRKRKQWHSEEESNEAFARRPQNR